MEYMTPTKKLYRSTKNVIWTGLLGGIGEYFEIDPVMIRVVFVVFLILTGVFPGVLIYIVALFIVPEQPLSSEGAPIRDAEVVGER